MNIQINFNEKKHLILVISLTSILLSCQRTEHKKVYYDNGVLKFKVAYQNGVKHGKHEEYHKNGKLKTVTKYNKGVLSDSIKGYYKNGAIEFVQFKTNGIDSIYTYDEKKGFLESKAKVVNKQVNGWRHFYNEKGKVYSKLEFIDIGEEKPYINQKVFLDERGLIIDSSSTYYNVKIKDTMILNKSYPIKINYYPSISKDSEVYFCFSHDIQEHFININEVNLDTIPLSSLSLDTEIKYTSLGLKNIRGFFVETKSEVKRNASNDTLVDITTHRAKMYFDIPVYVKDSIEDTSTLP